MFDQYPHYTGCLSVSSEKLENLKAFYDFESGVNDYLYNQLYSPTEHFVGSAINLEKLPALSIGKTDWPVTGNGYFSEDDLVKIGLRNPYENWSITLDINPDLCSYRSQGNVSKVLLSTMESPTSASGFHVGINQSNRLYIQYNNQGVRVETLPEEINNNAVVEVTQTDSNVHVHYYNLTDRLIYSVSTASHDVLYSDDLYLGDFEANSDPSYTGYKGYIKHAALFSGSFDGNNVDNHCSCMFSSGINVSSTSVTNYTSIVTGTTTVPIYESRVTGFVDVTSTMTQENGSNISIFYKSGLTGLVEVGQETILLTGAPTGSTYNILTSGIDYDKEKEKLYSRYFLNFRDGLASGEKIEIHSFENPQYDVGLIPDPTELFALSGDKIRLYYHGTFQQASGDKSFSSPHEYDYFVNASGDGFQLNGYTDPDPYLTYDLVNTGSICIDFSGLWGNVCSDTTTYYPTQTGCEYANKTWFTGEYVTDQLHDADKHSRIWLGNNLKWYPKFAQFIETGNDTVTITGVSGENGFVSVHDKDIYLNGQKLIYGKGYQTGMHSAYVCSDPQWLTKPDCEDDGDTWSVESVLPSLVLLPDLPGWAYEGTMATFNNGTVYMPDNVFAPELCFVPKTTGDTPNILVRDVSVAPDATVGGITDPLSGFSELVWLNGLRQQKRLDYQKGLECSLSKTFTIFEENPMVFYNNSADSINIE